MDVLELENHFHSRVSCLVLTLRYKKLRYKKLRYKKAPLNSAVQDMEFVGVTRSRGWLHSSYFSICAWLLRLSNNAPPTAIKPKTAVGSGTFLGSVVLKEKLSDSNPPPPL